MIRIFISGDLPKYNGGLFKVRITQIFHFIAHNHISSVSHILWSNRNVYSVEGPGLGHGPGEVAVVV